MLLALLVIGLVLLTGTTVRTVDRPSGRRRRRAAGRGSADCSRVCSASAPRNRKRTRRSTYVMSRLKNPKKRRRRKGAKEETDGTDEAVPRSRRARRRGRRLPSCSTRASPLSRPANRRRPEAAATTASSDAFGRPVEDDDADPADAEQLAIDLGPAAERPVWKLPGRKLLDRSEVQEVDRQLVEEKGRALESALAEHGVETRLVGMVVGPTVTRYELELGPGVKVARVTSLHKDIAYAMASPDVRILAPDPRSSGHRCRGAQREAPGGRARRHLVVGGSDARPSTRSRWRSVATSTAAPSWPTWRACPTS